MLVNALKVWKKVQQRERLTTDEAIWFVSFIAKFEPFKSKPLNFLLSLAFDLVEGNTSAFELVLDVELQTKLILLIDSMLDLLKQWEREEEEGNDEVFYVDQDD